MDVKIIFSSGGKFNKNSEQELADEDTFETAGKIAKVLDGLGYATELIKITPSQISKVKNLKTDVIFNLCEWSGKDYHLGVRVLKNLESRGIRHTGTDSRGYEWGCDKVAMKKMFDKLAIPTPDWIFVKPNDSKTEVKNKIAKLHFPLIAKPAYEHCAIGIDSKSILKSKDTALAKIMFLKKKFAQPILVEDYIEGREFTLTVVKNHELHVFPPAEVVFNSRKPSQQFLSFDLEWLQGTYSSKVLQEGSPMAKRLKNIARSAFIKMDCRGYIRLDVRVRRGKIYALELNVNPSIMPEDNYGLTIATKAHNWSFKKLVNEITESALS